MDSIPSYLMSFPTTAFAPPANRLVESLPWDTMNWMDFERLCYRLLSLECSVVHCQRYGNTGQVQEGIDIYAVKSGKEKRTVCQCKHYKKLKAADIKLMVSEFKRGNWFDKSAELILATSAVLRDRSIQDEIEHQRGDLALRGVDFPVWDRDSLDRRLRDLPTLVIDFFGREWARKFCGEDRLKSVGSRIDRGSVLLYRDQLRAYYERRFENEDGGLYPSNGFSPVRVPLSERFVMPDVILAPKSAGRSANVERVDPTVRGPLPVRTRMIQLLLLRIPAKSASRSRHGQ